MPKQCYRQSIKIRCDRYWHQRSVPYAILLTRKISHFRSGVHKTGKVRQLKNLNEDEFLRDLPMNDVSAHNNPNEIVQLDA